jgi:5-methylcytosine-specific restriction protein B
MSEPEEYSKKNLQQDEDKVRLLREYEGEAKKAIKNAPDPESIRFMIEDIKLDMEHEGDRGLGEIRREVLKSEKAPKDIKTKVSTRHDQTPSEVLVPEDVHRNAKTALRCNKPVVLYGPTGTGKTTFAKQLAIENSVGYSLNTATPSWTSKDIIGGIGPELRDGGNLSYRTELGCVAEGVRNAREFDINYTVVIDEITRADISKIFGPLYTAIENPHQTLIETEDGDTIELDPRVNIICTMNMSDRTVNELDNAITRRFAMIEVDEYEPESRRKLFETWIEENIDMAGASGGSPQFEEAKLIELFEKDYEGINEGREGTSQGSITRFGPMHYEDVTVFLGEATQSGDLYLDSPETAVGQAFRTYIVPRLLNSASYPQMERIVQHYRALDDDFQYDLKPAVRLAERQLKAEERQMGSYE